MRFFAALPILGLLGLWSLAATLWPTLPERVPMHFDLHGTPDHYVQRSVVSWFLLPALCTGSTALFAWVLPPWIYRLARANSALLNVPDRARFRALPTEGRVRALAPTMTMLRVLAIELTGLFGYILYATHAVATGAASQLSILPLLVGVGAIAATALGSIPFGRCAVRREAAAAARTDAPTATAPSPR